METYRCYRVDGGSGHFLDFVELRAASDFSAAQILRKIQSDRRWSAVELWQGGRMVDLGAVTP